MFVLSFFSGVPPFLWFSSETERKTKIHFLGGVRWPSIEGTVPFSLKVDVRETERKLGALRIHSTYNIGKSNSWRGKI